MGVRPLPLGGLPQGTVLGLPFGRSLFPWKSLTTTRPTQAQVSNLKRENEALRSGQGASLAVVKQNTDVALQNLHVVMDNARSSIK